MNTDNNSSTRPLSPIRISNLKEVFMYGSHRVKFIGDHSILCVAEGDHWEGDYDGPPIPARIRIHPSKHLHSAPPAAIIGAANEISRPAATQEPIMLTVAPASLTVLSNAQTKPAESAMRHIPAKPVRTFLERQFLEMQTGLGVTLIVWIAMAYLTVTGGPQAIWAYGIHHAFCALAVIIWAGLMAENKHKRTKAANRAANRSLMPSPPPPVFPKGKI